MGKQLRHSDLSVASVTSSIGPHPLVLMEDGTGLNKSQTQKERKDSERDFPWLSSDWCSCVFRSYGLMSVFFWRQKSKPGPSLGCCWWGHEESCLAACPVAHHSLSSGTLSPATSELWQPQPCPPWSSTLLSLSPSLPIWLLNLRQSESRRRLSSLGIYYIKNLCALQNIYKEQVWTLIRGLRFDFGY